MEVEGDKEKLGSIYTEKEKKKKYSRFFIELILAECDQRLYSLMEGKGNHCLILSGTSGGETPHLPTAVRTHTYK